MSGGNRRAAAHRRPSWLLLASKSALAGLVGWGGLAGGAFTIVTLRAHAAEAHRAPLPAIQVTLSGKELSRWKAFPMYRDAVPVLGFHGVGGKANYLDESRRLFAKQMEALKAAGFHTLTIQQYAAYVQGKYKHLPERPILLTFDDGRLGAYRASDAVLRAEGFKATELAVSGWVTANPDFSLSWAELAKMNSARTWQVQEHFGYGDEYVTIGPGGERGATFAYRQYLQGAGTSRGHLESFAHFKHRLVRNITWGERQMSQQVPGFRPVAMAIPESNYGQEGTNDSRIPPYVLSWLDRHFKVVLGGDYLERGPNRPFEIPGRFSRRLQYRIIMGPDDSLETLRCRLLDFVLHRPIWQEYHCYKDARPRPRDPFPTPHPHWNTFGRIRWAEQQRSAQPTSR